MKTKIPKIKWKTLIKLGLLGIVLVSGLILFSNWWVEKTTKSQQYDEIDSLPKMKTAMVLGTSRWASSGRTNLFFKYRMEAAASLFKAGKVKYILVSGDNGIKEYNETRDMTNYLMKLGIPEDRIVADYAGFSTLDSVVRSKEVFGQDSIIIISQPFHNERALFIANNYGLKAVAYNAKGVPTKYSIKTYLREYLARVKALGDAWIFHRMPKYYKEKENFPE